MLKNNFKWNWVTWGWWYTAMKCLNSPRVLKLKKKTKGKIEKGEKKLLDIRLWLTWSENHGIISHIYFRSSPKSVNDSLPIHSPLIIFKPTFHVPVTFPQWPIQSYLLMKDVSPRYPLSVRVTSKNGDSSSTM